MPDTRIAIQPTLARIAIALGVPVALFIDRSGTPDPVPRTPEAEAAELLSVFLRLQDTASRQRCLAFARALADREGAPEERPPS